MILCIIPADSSQPLDFLDVEPSLAYYQEIVGGYIEGVKSRAYTDGVQSRTPAINFFCNEEGAIIGLPVNLRASVLYGTGSPIFGNVICFGGVDSEGNELSLTDTQIKYLQSIFSHSE